MRTAPRTLRQVDNAEVWWKKVLTRATEGPHPWGWYQISATGRGGWVTIRIAIYPPGTSAAERRELYFLRNWVALGAIIGFLTFVALCRSVPTYELIVAVVAVYIAGIAVGRHVTRRVRPLVRRISAAKFYEAGGTRYLGDYELAGGTIERFAALDRVSSSLSAVEYEVGWAAIYDRIVTISESSVTSRADGA